MKNAVFWDMTSCGSCKNRRFRGTYHHQGDENKQARNVSSKQLPSHTASHHRRRYYSYISIFVETYIG
jgi:hypothetical protein